MHSQSPSPALGQHTQVTSRLSGLDHSKGIFLPWHRQIIYGVTSDLKEDACVRPTLESLAGRVQIARAEPERRCYLAAVAHFVPDGLQNGFIFVIHIREGQQCKVVA